MTKQLKRQGRVNRDPNLVRKIYQLEDIGQGTQILRSLAQYRLMTNQQIAELLFRDWLTPLREVRSDKTYQRAANQSLDRLINLGLVTRVGVTLRHRITQNKYMTHLNLLTRQGADQVQEWYNDEGNAHQVRWASSLKSNYHQTEPNHLVAINDALIHLARACWVIDAEVIYLFTDAELKKHFRGHTPDFFAVVQSAEGRLCPLFGEIDLGTMTGQSKSALVRDWTKKIHAYGAYFQTQYHEHEFYHQLGLDTRDMAHHLVLALTNKTGRLPNLVQATREAGGGGTYWHTTLAELYDDPDRGITNWLSMTRPIWSRTINDQLVNLADHIRR